jgi:thioredoxin-like negative regulator of GroEL
MASYDGKEKHGHEIQCVDVNCTKETPDIKDLLTEYNIESYPTVKMVKDGKTIEFDSKIKETTLEKFIDTMLN